MSPENCSAHQELVIINDVWSDHYRGKQNTFAHIWNASGRSFPATYRPVKPIQPVNMPCRTLPKGSLKHGIKLQCVLTSLRWQLSQVSTVKRWIIFAFDININVSIANNFRINIKFDYWWLTCQMDYLGDKLRKYLQCLNITRPLYCRRNRRNYKTTWRLVVHCISDVASGTHRLQQMHFHDSYGYLVIKIFMYLFSSSIAIIILSNF